MSNKDMEELVFKKPSKLHKRLIIIALIIIAIIIVLFSFTINLISLDSTPLTLTQDECMQKFNEWCNECYYINNLRTDFWDIGGSKIGESLAKCSNDYYLTTWTSEQDCTGESLNYCMTQLEVTNE